MAKLTVVVCYFTNAPKEYTSSGTSVNAIFPVL